MSLFGISEHDFSKIKTKSRPEIARLVRPSAISAGPSPSRVLRPASGSSPPLAPMGPGSRVHARRTLPVGHGGLGPHDRAAPGRWGARVDRDPGHHRGPGRHRGRELVQRRQGWSRQPDPPGGHRSRSREHPRQCRLSRSDRHRAPRPRPGDAEGGLGCTAAQPPGAPGGRDVARGAARRPTAGNAPSAGRSPASTTPGTCTSAPTATARCGAPAAARPTSTAPACSPTLAPERRTWRCDGGQG